MRSLSASELLEVWEQAADEHSVARALTLLSACCEETRQELANLSLGQRDARLFEIYDRLFGASLEAFVECPQCKERLEYQLSARDLASQPALAEHAPLKLQAGETFFRLRLLNSLDLLAVAGCSDPGIARRILLQRCVVEMEGPAGAQVEGLPESTVEKIASRLAQADPQAETLVDLACFACGHSWQVVLDVEAFLWVKLTAVAKRLLREVHLLARAYGWRDHDILALSSRRRQAYLEMVQTWPTF